MNGDVLKDILKRLSNGLTEILKDQLDGVYLYGSQARGDAQDDSDIDVLIVLKENFDYAEISAQTVDLAVELSLEYDVVISRVFVSKERYQSEVTPFLMNLRREAIPV